MTIKYEDFFCTVEIEVLLILQKLYLFYNYHILASACGAEKLLKRCSDESELAK